MSNEAIDVIPEDDTPEQGLVPETQERALVQTPVETTGLSPLVQAAMNGSLDTEKLKQLLEIQKDYESNEAEKAFHKALSEFKKHEIRLEKDKLVSFEMNAGGTKSYRHTTLGYALEVINPLLSQAGLSLAWETKQDMQGGGMITVTCVLAHEMGFSKSTSLSASPDSSGNKNSIQAIGSTISYLERYTAFSLVGLASMDQDDDGNSASAKPVEYITEDQANEIHAMIIDNELDMQKFLAWLKAAMKADGISQIAAKARNEVLRQIKANIKQHGAVS